MTLLEEEKFSGPVSTEFSGPVSTDYLRKLYADKDVDPTRLPYFNDGETLYLGSKPLKFDEEDNIILADKKVLGTRGLFKLIFMASPNKIHDNDDLHKYEEILIFTSAYLFGYTPRNRDRMKINT